VTSAAAAAAAAAAGSGSNAAAMGVAAGGVLQAGYSRTPFILRSVTGSPGHQDFAAVRAGSDGLTAPAAGGGSSSRGSSSGYLGGGGGAGVDQEGVGGGGGGGGLPPLPASQVYKLSCEYFSRPMLEPQVRGGGDFGGHRVCWF